MAITHRDAQKGCTKGMRLRKGAKSAQNAQKDAQKSTRKHRKT